MVSYLTPYFCPSWVCSSNYVDTGGLRLICCWQGNLKYFRAYLQVSPVCSCRKWKNLNSFVLEALFSSCHFPPVIICWYFFNNTSPLSYCPLFCYFTVIIQFINQQYILLICFIAFSSIFIFKANALSKFQLFSWLQRP